MDLMEICHSPDLILRAYESLISEAEHSTAFRNMLLTRARQTSLKRKKLLAIKSPEALSVRNFEALRSRIMRFSQTIAMHQPAAETKPE
jgi:beta-N-acetylhexosaminidase